MNQSEKALIASCGGYCEGCPFCQAFVNNDENRGKLRLAEELCKQLNMDIGNIKCLGCHGSIRSPWCASCSIQQCTEEKGILTCALCDEFPCEKLENFYDEENTRYGDEVRYGDESKAHILRQREIGLQKWLAEMKKQGTQKTFRS